METLPDELLMHIFSLFQGPKLILASVCTKWYKLSKEVNTIPYTETELMNDISRSAPLLQTLIDHRYQRKINSCILAIKACKTDYLHLYIKLDLYFNVHYHYRGYPYIYEAESIIAYHKRRELKPDEAILYYIYYNNLEELKHLALIKPIDIYTVLALRKQKNKLNIDVEKYAITSFPPNHEAAVRLLNTENNIIVYTYMKEWGLPMRPYLISNAIHSRDYNAALWFIENGCRVTKIVHDAIKSDIEKSNVYTIRMPNTKKFINEISHLLPENILLEIYGMMRD